MIPTDKIVIKGRPLNGVVLSAEKLAELGLQPRASVQLDTPSDSNSNLPIIWLSQPFTASRDKIGCLAYVADGEKYVARTFMLSRSQGIWRLLRRYRFVVLDDGTEKPTWHDKGYWEDSLFVPIEVQRAIWQLGPPLDLGEEGKLAFYGTAVDTDTSDDYAREISAEPIWLAGIEIPQRRQKVAPDLLQLKDLDQVPNFAEIKFSWTATLHHYGPTDFYVFVSQDGRLYYLFAKTADDRAWLAGIEVRSTLTSLGLRQQWVRAGDVTTPPWEYLAKFNKDTGLYEIDQTGGYGDETNRHKQYVDMHKNYVSKIPLIKEFVAAVG